MKYLLTSMLLLIAILIIPACSTLEDGHSDDTDGQDELFVSAAASLTEALDAIIERFTADHPSVAITLNLGGSGKLAQQIQQGAPVDVFLSANQKWMDVLADQNRIVPESRFDFVENELILIGKKDQPPAFDALGDISSSDVSQIAIGNPDSVPAGNYTKVALENVGIWNDVQEKLVYAKDVRQVLTYVESGNADVGFVYASDLLRTKKSEEIIAVPSELYSPIIYPAAIVTTGDAKEQAKQFMAYLKSDEAQMVFKKFGFSRTH